MQRGRQQQPAHKNERRGAHDAAAAMRSNGPENQQAFPAARVKHATHASTGTTIAAQRTAQHGRRCSSTCTLLTRPRVTRSITTSAQLHDMKAMCISAGAVASRLHANATQGNMRRTRPHGEHSATTQPRGSSACCRRRCAKTHFWHLMNSSGRLICARSSLGDSSLPSATATRASDTLLPVRLSGNERTVDDIDEDDATFLMQRAIFPSESCCHTDRVAEGGKESRRRGGGRGGQMLIPLHGVQCALQRLCSLFAQSHRRRLGIY